MTDESKENSDQQQDILHGLMFRLDGFAKEDEIQLQEDIETYGGNVLSHISKPIADFLVVPLNYESEDNRATTVVRRKEDVIYWCYRIPSTVTMYQPRLCIFYFV